MCVVCVRACVCVSVSVPCFGPQGRRWEDGACRKWVVAAPVSKRQVTRGGQMTHRKEDPEGSFGDSLGKALSFPCCLLFTGKNGLKEAWEGSQPDEPH